MKLKNFKFNRRTFIKRGIFALLSVEIIYVFTNLLKKSGKDEVNEGWFNAGNISFFDNNRVYPFGTAHFYLSKLDDGGMLAISTKCTHLGCTIQFNTNKDKFVCPCHASAFSKYGEVLAPPATRALDIYPIEIRDNNVMVDVFNPVRRDKYEASQLTYA